MAYKSANTIQSWMDAFAQLQYGVQQSTIQGLVQHESHNVSDESHEMPD
jgi:hypothetical protein